MSRRIDSAVKTAAAAPRVYGPAAMVEIVFDAGPASAVERERASDEAQESNIVRLTNAPFDVTMDEGGGAVTFHGIGEAGSISAIEEGSELQAYGVTARIDGAPREAVALALGEKCQGRPVRIWAVLFDGNKHVIGAPVQVFTGSCDTITGEFGERPSISMTFENRLADWSRPRVRRYTDEDHRSRFPKDGFFKLVPKASEVEITLK